MGIAVLSSRNDLGWVVIDSQHSPSRHGVLRGTRLLHNSVMQGTPSHVPAGIATRAVHARHALFCCAARGANSRQVYMRQVAAQAIAAVLAAQYSAAVHAAVAAGALAEHPGGVRVVPSSVVTFADPDRSCPHKYKYRNYVLECHVAGGADGSGSFQRFSGNVGPSVDPVATLEAFLHFSYERRAPSSTLLATVRTRGAAHVAYAWRSASCAPLSDPCLTPLLALQASVAVHRS